MPARAIADTGLSALDLRCLMAIAIHDGMSLVKGSGPGCYARIATLAGLVRTDISNFSKSLSKLVKHGYVVREPQQSDRRRFTLRVVYGDDDSWRFDQEIQTGQQSSAVGDLTNELQEKVGEFTNCSAKLVGGSPPRNGEKQPNSDPHYIPLNGEIDSVKTGEINSVESAHDTFPAAKRAGLDRSDFTFSSQKNGAEALAGNRVSIKSNLPESFPNLAPEAQLVKFESVWAQTGRNAEALDPQERLEWEKLFSDLSDWFSGKQTGHHAERLYQEIWLPPTDSNHSTAVRKNPTGRN